MASLYPHDLNVDLHMHSTASDGALDPADLVARAVANGVQIMALTDHDTVAGQAAAREAARHSGVHYVHGVEISVTWGGETIQVGRLGRARAMAQGLVDHGLPDLFDQAMGYAQNPTLIGRTHFARAMVAQGICSDMSTVFQRFLTPGKPGYLAHQWASLSQAVGAIRGAGGVAVLAHPARYRLSAIGHWALLDEFKALGGSAIEVVTGSHTDKEARRFQQVAVEHQLQASRGSAFQAVGESRFDVGAVPPLPDATRPVWHGWAH